MIFQIIFLVLLLLGGLEAVLRIKGKKPQTPKREESEIIPQGSYYKADPVLGFKHSPGRYSLFIKNRFHFISTHDRNGLRVDEPDHNCFEDPRPQIWVFGCSYTYGWLVENDESYPALLQKKMPEFRVINFGVNGYGTLQSYLQCKKFLEEGYRPVLAIHGHCGFHKKRNTVERSWKKERASLKRATPFIIPAGRLSVDGQLQIKYDDTSYRGVPFSSHSSLLNIIETRYNLFKDNRLKSEEVTDKILVNFNNLCKEHGVKFLIAVIRNRLDTANMLEKYKSYGLSVINIDLDGSKKSFEHTHLPYDSHPSRLAHRKYADALTEHIKTELIEEKISVQQLWNQ